MAARRVAESKATIPHLSLEAEVGWTGPGIDEPAGAAWLIRGVALALREHPRMNGAYRDGSFESYSRVNVGLAIGRGTEITTPTIFDADQKPAPAIAAELTELTSRISSESITSPELAGGTFTVHAVGQGSLRSLNPIINQGQAGTLAVGGISERAVVDGGQVVVAPMANIGLACDARIIGLGEAAEFLESLRTFLEEPERLA